MSGTTKWLDHEGNIMEAPACDEPTGSRKYERLTHRLMRPQAGQLIQAISWCGKRIHVVPGLGEVDCPECIEIQREHVRRLDGDF